MEKFKKSTIQEIEVGEVIEVKIAHRYLKGFGWDCYSESKYKVTELTPYQIKGINVEYQHEGIIIDRKDLDSGYLIIKSII